MQYLNNVSPSQKIDTSIHSIHRYSPVDYEFTSDLGNPSTALQNLRLQIHPSSGFQTGFHAWDLYFKRENAYKFWNVTRPYSDISYVQGQNRLLGLNFILTKNIQRNWNVGIEIQRFGSKGFYQSQNADVSRVRLFQSYQSPLKQSEFLFSLIIDKASQEVNGGITNTALFNQSSQLQRASFPVNLASSVNYIKQNHLYWEYNYGMGKLNLQHKDTTLHNNIYRYRIYYVLERSVHNYVDSSLSDDILYYSNIYKDSLRNFDSTSFIIYQNQLRIADQGFVKSGDSTIKKNAIDWHLGYELSYIKYSNLGYAQAKYYNQQLNFGVRYTPEYIKGFEAKIQSQYFISGYNAGDYLFKGIINQNNKSKNKHIFRFQTVFQKYSPAITYQYYLSNHYFWSKALNASESKSITLVYQNRSNIPIDLQLNLGTISNYIYFNTLSLPTQLSNSIQHASISAKIFLKWKKLLFKENLLLQYNSNRLVTPLPQWFSKTDICFSSRYKKTSLRYQIGISFNMWQQTQAYRWNPSIMQYVLDSVEKSGGYPMMDIYVNGEIKRFAFFAKFEHAFYSMRFLVEPLPQYLNFQPDSYFSTAASPMQPQVFRLGFRWRFYD